MILIRDSNRHQHFSHPFPKLVLVPHAADCDAELYRIRKRVHFPPFFVINRYSTFIASTGSHQNNYSPRCTVFVSNFRSSFTSNCKIQIWRILFCCSTFVNCDAATVDQPDSRCVRRDPPNFIFTKLLQYPLSVDAKS